MTRAEEIGLALTFRRMIAGRIMDFGAWLWPEKTAEWYVALLVLQTVRVKQAKADVAALKGMMEREEAKR